MKYFNKVFVLICAIPLILNSCQGIKLCWDSNRQVKWIKGEDSYDDDCRKCKIDDELNFILNKKNDTENFNYLKCTIFKKNNSGIFVYRSLPYSTGYKGFILKENEKLEIYNDSLSLEILNSNKFYDNLSERNKKKIIKSINKTNRSFYAERRGCFL